MDFMMINISSFVNINSCNMKLLLFRLVNKPAMSIAVSLHSLIICTCHKVAINYYESSFNVY